MTAPTDPALQRARTAAGLGLPPAKRSRFRSLRRLIVRLNWFTLRHQMDYNAAVVRHLTGLTNEIAHLRDEMVQHQHRVAQTLAQIEASLRSEILATPRLGEHVDLDISRLHALVAAQQVHVDDLRSRLTELLAAHLPPDSELPPVARLRSSLNDRSM